MIENLREYFLACPVLKDATINTDYLAPEVGSVSITPLKCEKVIKNYCMGGSLRQYCFALIFRCPYKGSPSDGMKNEQMCEKLAEWAESARAEHRLPQLENGYTAQSLEVMSGGFADDGTNDARYKVEFRLVYTKI